MSEEEKKEVDDEENEDEDEELPGFPVCNEDYDEEKFYYWDKKGIPTDEKDPWVRMERVFTLGGRDVRRETYFPA